MAKDSSKKAKRHQKAVVRRQQSSKARERRIASDKGPMPKKVTSKPIGVSAAVASAAPSTSSQTVLQSIDEPPFLVTRERDAWSTIRGFVYQVALTVERWLRLPSEDLLELENGEDIDICVKALSSEASEQERILEQVKHRESSLTLRTDEARTFLANAYEHRLNNPGVRLRFRFVTTATAGQENPTPLLPRAPAISRWGSLNSLKETRADLAAIEGIRSLLRGTAQPRAFSEQTWQVFVAFLKDASTSEFVDFMASIEWAMGHGAHEHVQKVAQETLLATGVASSPETAQSAYQFLFFYVFNLLATRGIKRLSRSDLLTALQSQQHTEADVALWKRVSDSVRQHDVRLALLEQESHASRLRIENLARLQGVVSDLVLVNQQFNFTPPSPAESLVARPDLLSVARSLLASSNLVNIFGEPGIGKTQLAITLVSGSTVTWVRLRHRAGFDALQSISAGVSNTLTNGHSYFVIDGLGKLVDDDPIAEQLAAIVRQPFKTITTGLFEFPQRLRANLGANLAALTPPLWSNNEVRKLFAAFGAPEIMLSDGAIHAFTSVTRGHPSLLRALVSYLSQRVWAVDQAAIADVFGGGYAASVRTDAQRLLRETLPEDRGRELLYRLDLVLGRIRDAELDAVSSVAPLIPLPRERLTDAKGLWIQDDTQEGMVLSPVLTGIGPTMLAPAVIKAVRTALAELIVRQRTLTSGDADNAIAYLSAAELWDRAAMFYTIAIGAYLNTDESVPVPAFAQRWLAAIPAKISPSLTALVGATQVGLLDREKLDASSKLAQVVASLELASTTLQPFGDVLAYVSAAMAVGPMRFSTPGKIALRLARLAVHFWRAAAQVGGSELSDTRRTVLGAIWLSVANVKSPEDVEEWASLLSFLSDDELAESNSDSDIALQGMRLVPRAFVVTEAKRSGPRWKALDSALERLEQVACSRGLTWLGAGSRAARILALGEYQNNIYAASALVASGLARYTAPNEEFLIRETYAHLLVRFQKKVEAISEFEKALAAGSDLQPTELVRTRAVISVLLRERERAKSIDYARAAVELAKTDSRVPRAELIRVLAELALALEADPHAAFGVWAEASEELLRELPVDDSERGLFATVAHSTGYFMHRVTAGSVLLRSSGQPMDQPLPSMFLRDTSPAAPYYQPTKRAIVAAHMESIANALGDDGAAIRWASRAVALATAEGDPSTRALLVRTSIPFMICGGLFATAIHDAAESLSVFNSPGEPPMDGERFSRIAALFPSILRVSTLQLNEDPIARTAAQEVMNACQERENSVRDGTWGLAARLVDGLFITDDPGLSGLLNRARNSGDAGLNWISDIAVPYAPAPDMEHTLKNQVLIFYESATTLQETRAMSRLLTFPFLASYWTRALMQYTRRFSLRFESKLERAKQLGGEPGVRAILSALLVELPPAALPEHLRKWLA